MYYFVDAHGAVVPIDSVQGLYDNWKNTKGIVTTGVSFLENQKNYKQFKTELGLTLKYDAGKKIPENKPVQEGIDLDMAKYEYDLKTQKSKGLGTLKKLSLYNYNAIPKVATVWGVVDVVTGTVYGQEKYPCFARPCPKTPRHGFVDSRTVNNKEELDAVVAETKAADPEGEVLLMPFLEPELNTIWTPAFMAVGKGHDGATAGVGSVKFPLNGICDDIIKGVLADAGVTEFPYIEAVSVKGEAHLTQLRNGPKLDSKPDFIPTDIVVKEIIVPDVEKGDLLGWENLMKAKAGTEGLVVYHPGGNGADHFCIHARCCGIPCIVTFKPEIGQSIAHVDTVPADYKAVLRGMVAADNYKFGGGKLTGKKKGSISAELSGANFKKEAALMLMGLHNSKAMEGESAYWLGVAITFMFRLGSMALRGEARHVDPACKYSRGQVYAKAANMKIQAHAKTCRNLISIFRYGWKPGGGGVGGTKWAQCGISLGLLFNAVREFISAQDEATYLKMIMTFNDVVNQAHNNGWWMNKFVSASVFETAQQGNLKLALEVAPLVWEIGNIYRNLPEAKVAKTVEMWGRWDPVDQKPPKTVKVEVEDMSSINQNVLRIKVVDRILRELRTTFTIALGDVAKKIPYGFTKELYLREGPSGMCIDLAIPGIVDEPVPVWEEKPLTIQKKQKGVSHEV